MFWKSSIWVLLLVSFACKERTLTPEKEAAGYFNPSALIEAGELRNRLQETGLRVIDFRTAEDYQKGHIPGAVRIWRPDIENPDAPVKGMMAGREAVEALFSRLGILETDTLVLYDDRADCDAARLWWVLQVYGFNQARLLNGGMHAWLAEGGPVTTLEPNPVPSTFRLPEAGASGYLVEADSLADCLAREACIAIDARSTDEFTGKRLKKGASRAGRIPGSHHRDWAGTVHYETDMTFRSREELQKIYAFIPEGDNTEIITYCHSGVRSAHTFFVLTQLLGYERVRNFDGSWIQWSALETAPVLQDRFTQILE